MLIDLAQPFSALSLSEFPLLVAWTFAASTRRARLLRRISWWRASQESSEYTLAPRKEACTDSDAVPQILSSSLTSRPPDVRLRSPSPLRTLSFVSTTAQ